MITIHKNGYELQIYKKGNKYYILYNDYCPTGVLDCETCVLFETFDCEYPPAYSLDFVLSVLKNHLTKEE